MNRLLKYVLLLGTVLSSVLLAGCITDIVTVPLDIAYDATKTVVVGTADIVGGTASLLTPSSKKSSDSDSKKTSSGS